MRIFEKKSTTKSSFDPGGCGFARKAFISSSLFGFEG
jgi:hypothetical protein